jgi:hypothetical protein
MSKLAQYLGWNFLAILTSSATGVLASHQLLSHIDLINSDGFAITYNYIGRDVVGQLGGLLFVTKWAPNLTINPMRSGVKFSALTSLSLLLEIGITILPYTSQSLIGLSLCNIGKNLGWIGMSGVNIKCLQTFDDEKIQLSQLYTQFNVTMTLASTIGMGVGLGLSKLQVLYPGVTLIAPLLSLVSLLSYRRSLQIALSNK